MKVTDKIEITNEDNMELMARYPDNYFDLAIVDPPYGLNMGGNLNVNSKVTYNNKKWDTETPSQEYFDELKRVSKNQIIWGWNYMTDKLPPCKGFIYWNKLNHHDNRSKGELAYCSIDGLAKHFEYMWDGNRYGFKGQKIQGVGKPTIRIHPTEKPISLYEWLLINYAKEIDCKECNNGRVIDDDFDKSTIPCEYCEGTLKQKPKILDTHLGSGSIAIACHDYGFELTACELDKEYYDKAIERIKNHTNQQKLF